MLELVLTRLSAICLALMSSQGGVGRRLGSTFLLLIPLRPDIGRYANPVRGATRKKTIAEHEFRKVIADLRTCEKRYQRLVDSMPATDETRLKSMLATFRVRCDSASDWRLSC